MSRIAYKKGYKYQLKETYVVSIPIYQDILTEYIQLDIFGNLVIKEGYAWDGPSGPTIDTKTFMRGSLVHDALYQLMREGHLDHKIYRKIADKILRKICIEDGMWPLRSLWVYLGVRLFADPASEPSSNYPVIYAP